MGFCLFALHQQTLDWSPNTHQCKPGSDLEVMGKMPEAATFSSLQFKNKKKRKTKTGKLIWKVRVSLPISVSLSPYCITLKLCKNVQTGDGWVLILCMIPLVLLSFPWWIIPDLKPSRSHHQGRILWWLAEINGPGFKRKPAASCFPKTKEAGYLHPSSKCSLNNNAQKARLLSSILSHSPRFSLILLILIPFGVNT